MGPQEIEALAIAKFGDPNRSLSTRTELRFGRKGSVAVCLLGDKAGLWFDHEAQAGGRLPRDADPDWRPPERRTRAASLLAWDSETEGKLRRIVDYELSAIDERSPAHLYLASRGIDRWPEHSVKRWIRGGVCYLARSKSGTVLAIQVVPLTDDGRKNPRYWPDGVTKRTYVACHGWHHYAAVRMPGRGEHILCEGVETGLSIWLATGRPVNACMGGAGLLALRVGRKLTIARDGDEPGSPADAMLAKILGIRAGSGQRVRVASPPTGTDFNDVYQSSGQQEVARLIRAARQ